MRPLFRAMSSALEHFIPPKRGDGFEDLCLDVFEYVLKKRGIPLVGEGFSHMDARGVSGDDQAGIDILDPATLAVAQCKNQKVISPSNLQSEVEKLLLYDDGVSHYFFLISHERVRKSLQDWVRNSNRKNLAGADGVPLTPCRPAERLPKFHIVGWGELKGYLLESNFLMWKWGLAHPVIHQYPYLPALDVRFLVETIEAIKSRSINTLDRRESKDAVVAMLRNVDLDALANIVVDEKVHREVFDNLGQLVDEWRQVLSVAKTYSTAVRDVDSRDPIIMEQGCALMNDLARYLPRMSVLLYLREICRASDELLKIFQDEESRDWEWITVNVNGEEREVEGDSTLVFNFSHTDWSNPYYVDPQRVERLVGEIVSRVDKARFEASYERV